MKRYAFRMKIKKGFEEEYVRRHKEVWRDVEKATVEAGIHNYSIFKDGRELFAYLESEDYEKAAKTLAAHPSATRWEAYMAEIMESGRANESGEDTRLLKEVFHLNETMIGGCADA